MNQAVGGNRRQIEQAGADALELNLYYLPTSINLRSEDLNLSKSLVREIRAWVSIPLVVKRVLFIVPCLRLCARLVEAGANG